MWTNSFCKLFRTLGSRRSVVASVLFTVICICGVDQVKAGGLYEGFEDLSALLANGWVNINHSDPLGTSPGWFQCTGTRIAPAVAGTTNSCVTANFASGAAVSTLNTWLLGPTRTFNNGDSISFWTRTSTANPYPDRLQVRLSTSGASTNVGTSATDVGDFTTLLLDINDTYQVGGYPDFWVLYSVTITGLSGPTSGRFAFRYFVEMGGPDGDNSLNVGIDSLTVTPAQHAADFDGDGRMDPTVVRNNGGGASGQLTWFIQNSSDGSVKTQPWGLGSDFIVPADFDGDHKADIAIWRPGPPFGSYFYILQSATNTIRVDQFGQTGDDPTVIGDYDGDGKVDPAVYRDGAAVGDHSFWFFRASTGAQSGEIIYNEWGQRHDFPAPGDYDGDGKNDFCVQRDNGAGQTLYFTRLGNGGVVTSTSGDTAVPFGKPNDMVVPGDYDGDGRTDIAVVRSIGGLFNWFVLPSSTGEITSNPYAVFGATGDYLTQGDWDGDGKTDPAVWRPNADPAHNYYYVFGSYLGEMSPGDWGQMGDYPAANYNAH